MLVLTWRLPYRRKICLFISSCWLVVFGGISSRTATAPLERVKIQAQMGNRAALMSQLSKILSKEGASGLWAGNFTNCLRVFPFAGLSCVFYSRFVKYLPCDNVLDPMEPFLEGRSRRHGWNLCINFNVSFRCHSC